MSEPSFGNGDHGVHTRIPVWNGDPTTFKTFERDMEWFLAGEDLTRIHYNLAVRIVNKQTGAVKRRGKEFPPASLRHKSPEHWTQQDADAHNLTADPQDMIPA